MKTALEIAKESLQSIRDHSADIGAIRAAGGALRKIKDLEAKESKDLQKTNSD